MMIQSLYLKIFLWFWLAMALVGLVLYFSTYTTMRERAEHSSQVWMETAMAAVIQTSTDLLENNETVDLTLDDLFEDNQTPDQITSDSYQTDETSELNLSDLFEYDEISALTTYVQQVNQNDQMNVSLFNQEGQLIAGSTLSDQIKDLAQQVIKSGQREIKRLENQYIVGESIISPQGKRLTLVGQVTGPDFPGLQKDQRPSRFFLSFLGIPRTKPSTQIFRLLAVFLTAGIVCYALARYLTAPLVQLRSATQKLTQGNLSARVTSQGRRRDELANLGSDFNLMAEKIQTMMVAQQRLLSDISHELRSPLARLKVALELVRQQPNQKGTEELTRIGIEADRLNNLISHLLTLNQMEENKEILRREKVNLTEIVRKVAADAAFEAKSLERNVRILTCISCTVNGNHELLQSAIENIVRNGVYYTATGTDVEITLDYTQNDSSEIAVRISDHGKGVPESELSKLFRPFYRVTEARDRETGGVGLGLAITDRAVKLHGGTVKAFNAPCGGLTVEIILPVEVNNTNKQKPV